MRREEEVRGKRGGAAAGMGKRLAVKKNEIYVYWKGDGETNRVTSRAERKEKQGHWQGQDRGMKKEQKGDHAE